MSEATYLFVLGLMVLAGAIVLGLLAYDEFVDHNRATAMIALLLSLSMIASGIGILMNSHDKKKQAQTTVKPSTAVSETASKTDYTLGQNMTTTVLPSSARSVTRY